MYKNDILSLSNKLCIKLPVKNSLYEQNKYGHLVNYHYLFFYHLSTNAITFTPTSSRIFNLFGFIKRIIENYNKMFKIKKKKFSIRVYLFIFFFLTFLKRITHIFFQYIKTIKIYTIKYAFYVFQIYVSLKMYKNNVHRLNGYEIIRIYN